MSTVPTSIVEELFDSVAHCFTPAVAEEVANLRYDGPMQEKIDDLRRKANEGQLSDLESREYEALVEAIDFIAILQAKSRALLNEKAAG